MTLIDNSSPELRVKQATLVKYELCSWYFPRKAGQKGKTGNVPKFGKLTEGKLIGTLRIPISGGKNGKHGNTKKMREKKSEILTKSPSIRTARNRYRSLHL